MKNITLFIVFVAILYFSTQILLELYIKLDAEKLNEITSPKGIYKVEKYIPLENKSILFTVDSFFLLKFMILKIKNIYLRAMFTKWVKGQAYLGHGQVSLTL